MGFMDKAKKMAEQAQSKLDEVQKQFNEGQGSSSQQGPVTQYDAHGRPVPPADAAPPAPSAPPAPPAQPHGDPLGGASAPPPPPRPRAPGARERGPAGRAGPSGSRRPCAAGPAHARRPRPSAPTSTRRRSSPPGTR